MGTRCLTEIIDGNQVVMTMYRQMDGYPSGHGNELKEAFGDTKIVNGYSGDTTKQANGMGCLAAQIVAHMKDGVGQFYLYPTNSRNVGEEFLYRLSNRDGVLWIEVYEGEVTFFGAGPIDNAPEDTKPIWSSALSEFNAEKCEMAYH